MKKFIRLPLGLAMAGFVFTFLLSFSRNVLSTSLTRGLLSGVLLFAIGVVVLWALGALEGNTGIKPSLPSTPPPMEGEERGHALDLTTPDEADELNDLIRGAKPESEPVSFEPLDPPKLTTRTDLETQRFTDALRTMSEE